jgi:hypothetical protein
MPFLMGWHFFSRRAIRDCSHKAEGIRNSFVFTVGMIAFHLLPLCETINSLLPHPKSLRSLREIQITCAYNDRPH